MVKRIGNEDRRRERIEKGSRERIEKERNQRELRRQFKEEEEDHHHLPLPVVQLPQGTTVLLRKHEFLTRFCSKALQ